MAMATIRLNMFKPFYIPPIPPQRMGIEPVLSSYTVHIQIKMLIKLDDLLKQVTRLHL